MFCNASLNGRLTGQRATEKWSTTKTSLSLLMASNARWIKTRIVAYIVKELHCRPVRNSSLDKLIIYYLFGPRLHLLSTPFSVLSLLMSCAVAWNDKRSNGWFGTKRKHVILYILHLHFIWKKTFVATRTTDDCFLSSNHRSYEFQLS